MGLLIHTIISEKQVKLKNYLNHNVIESSVVSIYECSDI